MDPNVQQPVVPVAEVPSQQPQIPPTAPYVKSGNGKKFFLIGIFSFLLISVILVSTFVFLNSSVIQKKVPVNSPTVTIVPTVIIVSPTQATDVITLKKGVSTIVPSTNLTLTFISRDVPGDGCADCLTTTEIIIKKDEEAKQLLYVCGGIAGRCNLELTEFNHVIKIVENLTGEELKVQVIKK